MKKTMVSKINPDRMPPHRRFNLQFVHPVHKESLMLTIALVVLSCLALFTSHYGWTRYWELLSHFQVQYWALSLTLLLPLVLMRQRWYISIGLFCCTLLATQVLVWYLPPRPVVVSNTRPLRVFIANLYANNRDTTQVLGAIHQSQPDVAVFLELHPFWEKPLQSLEAHLPYKMLVDSIGSLQVGLYSRYPLQNPQAQRLSDSTDQSITATVTIGDRAFELIAVHAHAPVNQRLFQWRNQLLENLSRYIATLKHPVVVMGDFNLSMWSPYYRRFSDRTSLLNARQGFGILPTWPTDRSVRGLPSGLVSLLGVPIDHCFVSPEIRVRQIRNHLRTGSDHRPLLVDLQLPQ